MQAAEPSWSFRFLVEEVSTFCDFSSFFFSRLRLACDKAGATSSSRADSEPLEFEVSSESLEVSTSSCLFRFSTFCLGAEELEGPSESEELDVETEEDMVVGEVVGFKKLIEIGLPNHY